MWYCIEIGFGYVLYGMFDYVIYGIEGSGVLVVVGV